VAKTAQRYFEGIGRRKTATARVRVSRGDASATVNGKAIQDYFQVARLGETALQPIAALKLSEPFAVSAHVAGGGLEAQAEAIRHGLARALAKLDPALQPGLHVLGFLTRDSRMVERKKFGLRKARRAPQWQKR
jgi:small subunit ribosomal protein S9